MTSKYDTRRGVAHGHPAPKLYADLLDLPYEYAGDDGRVVEPPHQGPWPTDVPCGDCGTSVLWAEGGFTPGHRICPRCGSHWELTSRDEHWFMRRARFYH